MHPATTEHRRDLDLLARRVGEQVRAVAGGADVADIDGWWARRSSAMRDVVATGYGRSAELGRRYLVVHASDHGVTLTPERAVVDLARVSRSLEITGPVAFKTAIRQDPSTDRALAIMRTRLTGSAERLTLGGSRETVEETIQAARVIIGYQRFTKANACKFCQMLAGRGAVYKGLESGGQVVGRNGRARGKQRVGRSFHDHCRCTVEPIYSEEAAFVVRPLTPGELEQRTAARRTRSARRAEINLRRRQLEQRDRRRAVARAQARVDNARRRARIEQARAAHLEEQRLEAVGTGKVDPELLRRYGVTEQQMLDARAIVKQVRADIRETARRESDNLSAWLSDRDLAELSRPSRLRQQTELATGRVRQVRSQSGYDWLEGLDEATERQVRRRFTDSDLYPPDVVAEQVRRVTNLDMTDDEAMDWLVDRWLHADGLRSISSGRLPRYVDPEAIIPADYGAQGYELARLFVDDIDEAAGHIAQVQAEQAEAYARRVLGEPRHGPAPWEMDAADYVAELEEAEALLAAGSLDPQADQAYRWAQDRIRELAPPDVDLEGATNPYELWERLRLTARTAGLLVE